MPSVSANWSSPSAICWASPTLPASKTSRASGSISSGKPKMVPRTQQVTFVAEPLRPPRALGDPITDDNAAPDSLSSILLNASQRLLANDQAPLCQRLTAYILRLAAGREERAHSNRTQNTVTFQRGAKSAQGRNGINGGDPRSGEEAVYRRFGLEQTSRSPRRVESQQRPLWPSNYPQNQTGL